MGEASVNRFEWAKAVCRDHELSTAARLLAYHLAVEYTNDANGKTNPSTARLCSDLGLSKATVKRCIRALVEGGWLHRTEGRGAGNKTEYTLLSTGNVVYLNPPKTAPNAAGKKGSLESLSSNKKGSLVSPKGVTGEPSYYKDEQSSEQRARAHRTAPDHDPFNVVFSGRATAGPMLVAIDRHAPLNAWSGWLRTRGLPDLCKLPIALKSDTGKTYFRLPWTDPPSETDEGKEREAREYFLSLIEQEAATHAAQ